MTEKPKLPPCEPQDPLCGVCAGRLEHDDDWLYCLRCRIGYPDRTGNGAAEYRHEDDKPCGKPPREEDVALYAGWLMRLLPCSLPAPHTSDCYHPLIERQEA